MLSTQELQYLLKKVTYKPGWSFRLYDGKHEGQHIVITTQVIDAYNPDQMTTLDVHSMLPPMDDAQQFMNWLLWRLKRIEAHECREFFRVDGVVYDDPHAEFAGRDEQ